MSTGRRRRKRPFDVEELERPSMSLGPRHNPEPAAAGRLVLVQQPPGRRKEPPHRNETQSLRGRVRHHCTPAGAAVKGYAHEYRWRNRATRRRAYSLEFPKRLTPAGVQDSPTVGLIVALFGLPPPRPLEPSAVRPTSRVRDRIATSLLWPVFLGG